MRRISAGKDYVCNASNPRYFPDRIGGVKQNSVCFSGTASLEAASGNTAIQSQGQCHSTWIRQISLATTKLQQPRPDSLYHNAGSWLYLQPWSSSEKPLFSARSKNNMLLSATKLSTVQLRGESGINPA